MNELILFPRLHNLGVRHLVSDMPKLTGLALQERIDLASPYLSWGSSGGSRAGEAHLEALREDLMELAMSHGFPDVVAVRRRALFDSACAAWLLEHGPIVGGEALRDDVWAFVACCIAPDICSWRFGAAHPERFAGGVRNIFQRLWLRAKAFDRGEGASDRWELVRELTEDATVQVIERPAVAADARLARAIGEAWLASSRRVGSGPMEAATRMAVRRLRITNQIVCLGALEQAQLDEHVGGAFAAALA